MRKWFLVILVFMTACGGADSQEVVAATSATPAQSEGAVSPALTGEDVWQVDPGLSAIKFTGTHEGSSFDGSFEEFDAQIKFDPENLSDAYIRVVVDIASFDGGDSADRNSAYKETDWFDLKNHAKATFTSSTVTATENGQYEAAGTLMMKGIEKEIVLPFTLNIDGDKAIAEGSVSLNRLDYNLGTGDFYKNDSLVAHQVSVSVIVHATR